MVAGATVIIRSRNKSRTIEATLRSVRTQSVPAEIVVVDSGSVDDTVAIARRHADRVVQIPRTSFSYGGALNIGAGAASGDVHFALSAHSTPHRRTWIEESLEMYERRDVAGTNGTAITPAGATLEHVHYQQPRDVVDNAEWGFSNHGSSWRASVWADHPFRDDLPAAEDKEWSWRVLAAGWTIAYSPRLTVTDSHRRGAGPVAYAQRILKERGTLASMGAVGPLSVSQAVDEWWNPRPHWVSAGSLRRSRLSPWRMIDVVCTYLADHRSDPSIDVPAMARLQQLAASRVQVDPMGRTPVSASAATTVSAASGTKPRDLAPRSWNDGHASGPFVMSSHAAVTG